MSTGLKTVLYILLGVGTIVFGSLAYRAVKQGIAYREVMAEKRMEQASDAGSSSAGAAELAAQANTNGAAAATNGAAASTNAAMTNAAAVIAQVLGSTNTAAALTNVEAAVTNATALSAAETNGAPEQTNQVAAGNGKAKTKGKGKKARKPVVTADGKTVVTPPQHMGVYIGLLIFSALGLGTLIAYDVSHFMGNRALKTLYNDDLVGIKDPQYDEAENVWANGDHLEAIRMMREYLNKNPREQHVALRIAEIYEKDLNNPLAAALEYEQVLKQKLPAERWGWAAIHLCNLYFKLDKEDKAVALLQRIDREYGQTAAAEKARKRLEQMGVLSGASAEEADVEEPEASAPEVTKGPKLPPGFAPKKR